MATPMLLDVGPCMDKVVKTGLAVVLIRRVIMMHMCWRPDPSPIAVHLSESMVHPA